VVAPGAGIRLVLARSDADADVLGALRYAVDGRLGDVVSMSYGEAETCLAAEQLDAVQHRLFSQATAKRMTLVASSGNTGAGQPTCDGTAGILAVQTPASDPLVTAVGGTNLTADLVTGEYQQERAWADGYGLSGGGLSSLYEVPAYQGSLRLAARGIPDVAYNAGIVGGVLGYWSSGGEPGFYVFGGTSSGAPQWAGIAALTGQQAGGSLGEMNPSLYRVGGSPDEGSAFNDIVRGDNRLPVIGGYQTRRGWDLVTGWGTPRADRLVPLLAVLAEEVATASGSPPPAR
jgi:subtilase family serine protease